MPCCGCSALDEVHEIETGKHKMEKKLFSCCFEIPVRASLIPPVTSSSIGNVLGKGVSETQRRNKMGNFPCHY